MSCGPDRSETFDCRQKNRQGQSNLPAAYSQTARQAAAARGGRLLCEARVKASEAGVS
eukprot:SAG31_NODE_24850_length_473_cov_0.804813_1_plen_57_part_10